MILKIILINFVLNGHERRRVKKFLGESEVKARLGLPIFFLDPKHTNGRFAMGAML